MHLIDREKGCPICKSRLTKYVGSKEYILKCVDNGCFEYDFSHSGVLVYIFSKQFICGDLLTLEIDQKVKDQIKYWKENDRYLMKLLIKE